RWGSHTPLAAIQGLADLGQLAPGFEYRCTLHITEKIIAPDFHGAVVAPAVGKADLVDDRVQLFQRLFLCLRTYPRELLDIVLHALLDLTGHFQGVLLGLLAKSAIDELLSQRFAELAVREPHAALLARRNLLHPAQRVRVKVKVRLYKFGRK